jgi:hypothetical protein
MSVLYFFLSGSLKQHNTPTHNMNRGVQNMEKLHSDAIHDIQNTFKKEQTKRDWRTLVPRINVENCIKLGSVLE